MALSDLTGRSLLAVFAHPDDESIACGGLLARCAELGVRVSLVCATHGEHRSGTRDTHLYDRRAEELHDAARILGIAEVILYDFADGFLPWLEPPGEFEARLEADIRRIAPDIVVTFGDDGLYWHPDHIAIHEMTTKVVAAFGEAGPALYYVTMPPGMMRAVVDEYFEDVVADGVVAPLLGLVNPDAFGISAEPPTLVIDVSACAMRKLAALKCHHSQVEGGALARIPEKDAPRLFRVEHFHRACVGSTAATFLEHLGSGVPDR